MLATIRETVTTLGVQRGYARYYAQGAYLARAGFTPTTYLDLHVGEHELVLRPSATPTHHRVSAKQQGRVPVVDLTAAVLEATLGGPGTELNVRVALGSITLSRSVLAQRVASRPRDRSVGSVFSGGGLLDQAAVQAGFTARFGIEVDEGYAATFETNHPDATCYRMSVHEAALQPLPQVELLCLGVPCEPFSTARRTDRGTGAKRDATLPATAHELGDMALWAFACILRCNPRTVVLENAPGFAKSETCYALAGALRRCGYHVHWDVINATQYGGLTERKRTVLVASTDALQHPWPEPVAATQTVGAALDTYVPPAAWFDATSKPWVFEHAAKQAAKGNGFGFSVVQAGATRMPCIKKRYQAGQGDNPMLAHPTRPDTYRWFSVTECARFMGLDSTFVLPEAKTTAGEVLGQGVDVTAFTHLIKHVTQ